MIRSAIIEYLSCLGVSEAKGKKPGWVTFSCPFALTKHENGVDKNPSMGIEVKESGVSRYHCFSCESSGNLFDMLDELKMGGYEADFKQAMKLVDTEEDLTEVDTVDLNSDYFADTSEKGAVFPEWWLDSFVPAWDNHISKSYLKERGVERDTAKFLDIRWDGINQRVGFPFRDSAGNLRGMQGRTTIDIEPRYFQYDYEGVRNMDTWFGEHWIDWDCPIIMVESVFDVAAVRPLYANVMAPMLTKLNPKKIKRVLDAESVLIMFDGDEAGRVSARSLEQELTYRSIQVEVIDLPKGTDPGSLVKWQLETILAEAMGFGD